MRACARLQDAREGVADDNEANEDDRYDEYEARTVYTRKGAAVVGPERDDVVGVMHKYCKENANEAEDGEEKEEVDDRQCGANEGDDLGGFEALFTSLSSVGHAPLGTRRGSYGSLFFKS